MKNKFLSFLFALCLPVLGHCYTSEIISSEINSPEQVTQINNNFRRLYSSKLDLRPGDAIPKRDITYYLGDSNFRWLGVYSAGIFTSTITASSATFTNISATTGTFTNLVMSGQIDMNSNKIVELANGSASSDAAAFGQIPVVATQAQEEAGSVNTAWTSPGVQHYHPSAAKAWVVFQGTGTVNVKASHNVASISDGGAGTYTVNFSTGFSSVNYTCVCTASHTGGACRFCMQSGVTDPTVSAFTMTVRGEAFTAVDADRVHVACYGDQ